MKKIICLILSIILAFQLSLVVQAETINCPIDYDKIISALQANERIKSSLGLEDVDFSDFCVSNPIHSYNYTVDGVEESSLYIPLLINGELRAFAISYNNEYHISTFLSERISTVLEQNINFAIIFDKNSVFVFDGINLLKLSTSTTEITNRGQLNSANQIAEENIVLASIGEGVALGYRSEVLPRIPIYYECGVNYVPQGNYGICWAASIACIVNYKNNDNLTAVEVARGYFGENFNQGITIGEEDDILQSYGLNYTTLRVFATDNEILMNIRNDYPVYSTCNEVGASVDHDVVIYGINISSAYLYIMDPNVGSVVAYYDSSQSKYYYYSPSNGSRCYFKYSTCRYWDH